MDNKSTFFRQPADGGTDSGQKTKTDERLKQRLNAFLIAYYNYLVMAVALVIFAAGLFLFVYPQFQQTVKTSELAKQTWQAEYEKKLSYLNSVGNLKKSYQLVGTDNEAKVKAMVPADKDISGIISTVETVALKNGVILNSVRIDTSAASIAKTAGAPTEKKEQLAGIFEQLPRGVGRVKIEINLSSIDYQVLKNVVKTLENNLRLFDIAKINYSVGDHKAILTVFAYYLQ